jgi:hypothetical protein
MKNTIKTFLILITLFLAACADDDKNNPFNEPEEEIEMFPFLKVGNVFTYQYDYHVICGT